MTTSNRLSTQENSPNSVLQAARHVVWTTTSEFEGPRALSSPRRSRHSAANAALDTRALKGISSKDSQSCLRRTTMKKSHLITISAFCLLAALSLGLLIQNTTLKTSAQANNTPSKYRLSGPYTHKNLTIFLVHGKDLITGHTFLTLQEALAQKKVIVYETKDVNELAIRNLSNQDVYVQAGDIVRGGDQDRMISLDFIVPRNSKRMPIAAFCVESGRWSRRGN